MKYLKDFSELITENKTEALRKKYVSLLSDKFDIDLQKANTLFDDLSKIEDPTLNKVYLQWVLNNIIKNFDSFSEVNHFIDEDFYKWKEYLKIYHKVKDKLDLDKKNIQSLSLEELTDIALKWKEKEQEIGTKNEVLDKKYKINENNEYLVYMFKTATEEDFQFYQLVSTNTEWCTRPNYKTFKNYINKSPLFVFINKQNRSQKYQFHQQTSQFMDKNDEGIDYKLKIYFIKLISGYLPEDFIMKITIKSLFGFIDNIGLIDNKGNVIAKGFKAVYPSYEGFTKVKFQDNSYGFINKQGNIIAKGFKDASWRFYEGFATVKFQDNSCGYINKQGEVIAKGFKDVGLFKEGFAWVQFQDYSYGFINKQGNIYEKKKKTLINKNDPRLKGIKIYPEKFIQ